MDNEFLIALDERVRNMKELILDSPNLSVQSNKCWYISEKGNDRNSGESPELAWQTPHALSIHKSKIQFGDAVLFERGGLYRGTILAQSGVYYGAYGSGPKPCIFGSRRNYVNSEWEQVQNRLWRLELEFTYDVGIIVFNHGESVGVKKHNLDDVQNEFDFYCEAPYIYLFMNQDPSLCFSSIEIGDLNHIFFIPENTQNVTIENFTIKYGGGHAIVAYDGSKNISVRNCEICWIGGCYLPNYGDGKVRFGNGVEFWKGCEDILVENCWVYQIYDSGLSHQGNGSYIAKNITFQNNLVEYCSFGSIEYWLDDSTKNSMENVRYNNNILRFAGYGWGSQRPDKQISAHITGGNCDNLCREFYITNNIFEYSTSRLIRIISKAGTFPKLIGNTYIEKAGGTLGYYNTQDLITFDDDVLDVIKTRIGDSSARVVFG